MDRVPEKVLQIAEELALLPPRQQVTLLLAGVSHLDREAQEMVLASVQASKAVNLVTSNRNN